MANTIKPSELPDDVFNKAFEDALHKNAGELKLTEKEQESFANAMKKPEFTSMLKEYMDEISDPKHREEQEAYIRQLEQENRLPEGRELIQPEAGFCVKTKMASGGESKCFINICTSSKVEAASRKSADKDNNNKGQEWSVPYSIGPVRHEHDNKKVAQPTVDFCVHPDTFTLCNVHPSFQKMVVETAIDAVDARCSEHFRKTVKLDRKYRVLKGVKAMGGKPAILHVTASKTEKKNPYKVVTANKTGNLKELPTKKEESGPKPVEPRYTLVHRGMLDISEFVSADSPLANIQTPKRPKELVLKIQMPRAKSTRHMELDVSDLSVHFTCPVGDGKKSYYDLKVSLPYPVMEKKGSAKYEKEKKLLVVTLPVVAPTREEMIPESLKPSDTTVPQTTEETVHSIPNDTKEDGCTKSSDFSSQRANGMEGTCEQSDERSETSECKDQSNDNTQKERENNDTVDALAEDFQETGKISEDCVQDAEKTNEVHGTDSSLQQSDSTSQTDFSEEKESVIEKKYSDPILQAAYEASLKPLPVRTNHEKVHEPAPPKTVEHIDSLQVEPITNSTAEFEPSTVFQGPKKGYVFKKDSKGIGYYLDTLKTNTANFSKHAPPKGATETVQNAKTTTESAKQFPAAKETGRQSQFQLRNAAIFDLE